MILFFLILATSTSVEEGIPSSPTSATAAASDLEELEFNSSLFIRSDGGSGAFQNLSIRGSTSKEVGVFFEGIRLNSFASGEFDLGLISPWGLSNPMIIKGGHHSYSASPQGALFLKLPDSEAIESRILLGDYQTFGFFQRIPGISLSIDQSENDYPYRINDETFRRTNNSHQRINLRLWRRWSSGQIWSQILSNDLELPGPATQSFTPSRTLTIRPMIAGQYRWGSSELNLFANYQRQSTGSSINHLTGGMARYSHKSKLAEKVSLESSFEESVDYLSTEYFESPLRSLSLATLSFYLSPSSTVLLNPQLQADLVSDLDRPWGVSGGLGARWSAAPHLSLRSQMAYVSRIPNFNEMYFEIPPAFVSNQSLRREPSLQFDFGYEFKMNLFTLSQNIFWIRTNDTISSVYSNGVYQAQNLGSGARLGLESDLRLSPHEDFEFQIGYQVLRARLIDSDVNLFNPSVISKSKLQLYQPTHKVVAKPIWRMGRLASLSLPLSYRSKVRASLSDDQIGQQLDLSMKLSSSPIHHFPFSVTFEAQNILGWNREETFGYPLGSEPRLQLSLSRNWN